MITHPEIPTVSKWSDLERLGKEKELIGIYLSAHPLDDYEFILKHVCNANTLILSDLESVNGKEVSFGGLVTSVREGQTKRNSPYTIFKIEDYEGSFEIALFGEDSINFSKYARMGMAIYISARVQPKRYRENELEVKIQSIKLLTEVKDTLISKLTLQINLNELDDTMVTDLSALIKNNPGNTLLYFQITSIDANMKVQLFSRPSRVEVNKHLIDYLEDYLNINFKIN
jgi:DNA polymerase-3 subunit alpha